MQATDGFPVVTGASYFLAHVPGLVRYGSKPTREIEKSPDVLGKILPALRGWDETMSYPPHQVFIGNLRPDALRDIPRPWFQRPYEGATRFGPFGEIMPEHEFLAVLKMCDEFGLVLLEEGFVEQARKALGKHPLFKPADFERLGKGVSADKVQAAAATTDAAPLYVDRDRLVGCVVRGHEEDPNLIGPIMLENLVCKASAMMAVRWALTLEGSSPASEVDYLFGCGEEATGDRYQPGGGAMAKSAGEMAGCVNATASDVKAYCCAPVHALALAGSTVQTGMYKNVIVVGGGSLAKMGMKYQGHLKKQMPVLEDTVAAIAVSIAPNDGRNPQLRLDSVGRHHIGSTAGPQVIAENLVVHPLERIGRKILDIDKYATEMHDPDVTETAGAGNVPRNNYRILGSVAVQRGEMAVGDLDGFERTHGMPGFSPTQGHIASAIPFMGHARDMILKGEIKNTMFFAKGSLFLGKMTQMSDGLSVVLERNGKGS